MLYSSAFLVFIILIIVIVKHSKECQASNNSVMAKAKILLNPLILALSFCLSLILTTSIILQYSLMEDSKKFDECINYVNFINEEFGEIRLENPDLDELMNKDLTFLNSLIDDLDESIEKKAFWLYFR